MIISYYQLLYKYITQTLLYTFGLLPETAHKLKSPHLLVAVVACVCQVLNFALSHFSQCSASCGRGFKYRNVTCVGQSGQPITEENCLHLPFPQKQKRCRGGRCPKWKTASWGEVKFVYGMNLFFNS